MVVGVSRTSSDGVFASSSWLSVAFSVGFWAGSFLRVKVIPSLAFCRSSLAFFSDASCLRLIVIARERDLSLEIVVNV